MKKYWLATGALVLVLAGTVGFIAYRSGGNAAVQEALARQNAMEWLRVDFALTDTQFTAIKALHDSYASVCEGHCRQIQEAMQARAALKASGSSDATAIAAADRRLAEMRAICESAIAAHVQKCAEEMSPESRQRYLALVLPKIKDFDHMTAPDVQLNPHAH